MILLECPRDAQENETPSVALQHLHLASMINILKLKTKVLYRVQYR